jgi:phosphate transport system substrate-binding protein
VGRVLSPFHACALGVLGALILAASPGTARAELLRIGGTGAALATMQAMGDAFLAHHRGRAFAVEVLPALGSGGGIRAADDGVIAIAVSQRDLQTNERGRGLAVAAYGRTPFVFVTGGRSTLGVTTDDIVAIYRGDRRTWGDGTPIRPVLRPKDDAGTRTLEKAFPELTTVLDNLRRRGSLPVATTDQDNLDFAQRIDGSFTVSTLAQIISEKVDLRILTLNGIAPTLVALQQGAYPLSETFYLIFREGDAGSRLFVDFVRSPAGQRVLRQHGTLPVDPPL